MKLRAHTLLGVHTEDATLPKRGDEQQACQVNHPKAPTSNRLKLQYHCGTSQQLADNGSACLGFSLSCQRLQCCFAVVHSVCQLHRQNACMRVGEGAGCCAKKAMRAAWGLFQDQARGVWKRNLLIWPRSAGGLSLQCSPPSL